MESQHVDTANDEDGISLADSEKLDSRIKHDTNYREATPSHVQQDMLHTSYRQP